MSKTGSKIQASLGQAGEVFWAVYVNGELHQGYITDKTRACMIASKLRNGTDRVKVVRQ